MLALGHGADLQRPKLSAPHLSQVTDNQKDILDGVELKELAFPEPGPGQAVVRIVLRAMSLVKLELLHGARAATVKLPCIPSFGGLGIVEQLPAGSDKNMNRASVFWGFHLVDLGRGNNWWPCQKASSLLCQPLCLMSSSKLLPNSI
ncbi:hypothetical protein WJX74_007898 [Apatococcus lobatus]|uniref:Uncharacterized protein n=1 Tax=Apatococcus lobatus TaxID=904363 RepID=A0AAW1S4I5_9CHLO